MSNSFKKYLKIIQENDFTTSDGITSDDNKIIKEIDEILKHPSWFGRKDIKIDGQNIQKIITSETLTVKQKIEFKRYLLNILKREGDVNKIKEIFAGLSKIINDNQKTDLLMPILNIFKKQNLNNEKKLNDLYAKATATLFKLHEKYPKPKNPITDKSRPLPIINLEQKLENYIEHYKKRLGQPITN